MKVIAVAAVTAGGKTTVVNEIKKRLPRCASLHFDDYSFEGEVEDFHQWVVDGADYDVWNLAPLKADIDGIISRGETDVLLLDYPFAYLNSMIRDYIDCAVFIDTPLDIAMEDPSRYEGRFRRRNQGRNGCLPELCPDRVCPDAQNGPSLLRLCGRRIRGPG